MENEVKNFIDEIIIAHNKIGKFDRQVHTRFPPEPNGYLHIGHAKSICLNFSTAEKFHGTCNLRFDDTNPTTEEIEYVDSIKEDVQWLGFQWHGEPKFTSDYFQKLYDFAVVLIKKGLAYVDEQSTEEIAAQRGDVKIPGKNSPFRIRSIEENLAKFEAMKNGLFEEGACVLRAKIDMASPNMHMRDPAMYRVKKATHHRTGDDWLIYPMYDWAHGLSDSIEGITHSLCTLEFENHRPLYDWFLEHLDTHRSQQIEFARMNVSYMITSKRKLKQLVDENIVDGWDDPRMSTISGLRRRGFTPGSLRNFCERVGVAKRENLIDFSLLEFYVREELNKTAPRKLGVLKPLKLIIQNYPEGGNEMLLAVNNPEDQEAGKREIPFSKEIYIDKDDFMIDPPRKFFRLAPGRKVRLKYAYIIECLDFITNPETGEVETVICNYFPETKSGSDNSGIKVKGTLGWVDANKSIDMEVRLYDRLFKVESPGTSKEVSFMEEVNEQSLISMQAKMEPSMAQLEPMDAFQLERQGYFIVDKYSSKDHFVLNRTVTLKDTWGKIANKKY